MTTPTTSATASGRIAMMLTLADSRLPVGGHVHSGGIEEAIYSGFVYSIPTFDAFLRRRIVTTGLVSASIAAALCKGNMNPSQAEAACDARTPSEAARDASRAQGRGFLRLAKHAWPDYNWTTFVQQATSRPHVTTMLGTTALITGISPVECAAVTVYTVMTSSAIAGQRLLALDPAEVAVITLNLVDLINQTAQQAAQQVCDLADPLMDILAERHRSRERPLFVS